MKPKHRIFCPQCGYAKMLFNSEKKANLYLLYNSNDVMEENGKKPIRSYYCEACGGWHVTSCKSFRHVDEKDKKILYDGNIKTKFKNHIKSSDIEYHKICSLLDKIKKK